MLALDLHPGAAGGHIIHSRGLIRAVVKTGEETAMDERKALEAVRMLNLLAECEEAVAGFYASCAQVWPEDRPFWQGLEKDEHGHAWNLHRMGEIVDARPESFTAEKLFSPYAIRTMIEGLQRDKDRVLTGRLTENMALSISHDLESSLIEKQYKDVLQSKDTAYNTLLREIIGQTGRHAARTREMRVDEKHQTVYAL